jgi:hypothetical protein
MPKRLNATLCERFNSLEPFADRSERTVMARDMGQQILSVYDGRAFHQLAWRRRQNT